MSKSLWTSDSGRNVFVFIPEGWPFESNEPIQVYATFEDAHRVRAFHGRRGIVKSLAIKVTDDR